MAARELPSGEMSRQVRPLWCSPRTPTQVPEAKSQRRTRAVWPSWAVARMLPSLLKAIATTWAVCPRQKRCLSPAASMATTAAPEAKTISLPAGPHFITPMFSPEKPFTRSSSSQAASLPAASPSPVPPDGRWKDVLPASSPAAPKAVGDARP